MIPQDFCLSTIMFFFPPTAAHCTPARTSRCCLWFILPKIRRPRSRNAAEVWCAGVIRFIDRRERHEQQDGHGRHVREGQLLEQLGSDVPFGKAVMVQDKINLLRYSLTQNEICRYQDPGDSMSEALEMCHKHHQGGPQGDYNSEYPVPESKHEKTQLNQRYCHNPVAPGTKTEDAFIALDKGPLFIMKLVSFPKLTMTVDTFTMERPGMLVV
jgi:hypothetical protein